jgi:MFS family permease
MSRLPSSVVALGFVSLLMDTSSEMIHGLLPVFLVGTLAVSATTLGLIDGAAEATAALTKLFSGALSDRLPRRKPLLVWGYGLAALTKPFFALASTVGWVVGARLVDRVGKGIRGAPRDALIADVTPEAQRGAAYGLRQSMDTAGAMLGPLVGLGLMHAYGDIRLVFWASVVPAALCVGVVVFGVREPVRESPRTKRPFPIRSSELRRLPPAFWGAVGIAVLFTAARLSEAFLVLSSRRAGWSDVEAPLVLVAMNGAFTASAWPLGRLSDVVSRRAILVLGAVLLMAGNLVLAWAESSGMLVAGLVLWGLHMGASQGLFSALVADTTPSDLRGTAFGVLQATMAVALFGSALLAGLLWDGPGPAVMWVCGAVLAGAVALLLAVRRPPTHSPGTRGTRSSPAASP